MQNPYTIPHSLNVDDYFKDRDAIMPFVDGGAFKDIEEMRQTFTEPDRLEIVGNRALQLRRE